MSAQRPLLLRIVRKAAEGLIPIDAVFELTHRCNLRCRHCYIDSRGGTELSVTQIENVLDQLAAQGTLFLTLTGGEIFVRCEIIEIIELSRSKGFSVRLYTNGTLITEPIADKLATVGLLKLEVSLYGGDSRTHDSITAVKGSFERTLRAVKILKERSIPVIIKVTWMKENYRHYRKILEIARELEVPLRGSASITPMNNGDNGVLCHRCSESELFQFYVDVFTVNWNAIYTANQGSLGGIDHISEYPCGAGIYSCCIAPNGDLFPCIQIRQKLGNIVDEGLANLWTDAPFLQTLRRTRRTNITACEGCAYQEFCFRCPGLALLEDGNLVAPSSEACLLAKVQKRAKEFLERVRVIKKQH